MFEFRTRISVSLSLCLVPGVSMRLLLRGWFGLRCFGFRCLATVPQCAYMDAASDCEPFRSVGEITTLCQHQLSLHKPTAMNKVFKDIPTFDSVATPLGLWAGRVFGLKHSRSQGVRTENANPCRALAVPTRNEEPL